MLEGWQFKLDNPTVLGWSVVAVYGLGAIACLRAGCRAESGHGLMWRLLAAGLLFLGVNKQLNLQTMMIVCGRNLFADWGLTQRRRAAQLAFSIVFGMAAFAAAAWLARRQRDFFQLNPWAFAGCVILVVFVALRAATINHADQFLRVDLHDDQWGWVMEMAGSLCLTRAALRACPPAGAKPA